MAYKSQPTVTRPANATPYTAGDVVGGAFQLTGLPPGRDLLTTLVALRINVSGIPAGMTSFTMHYYAGTPPSAIADNDQWDLTAADRAVYLGFTDVGSPADKGATLFCQVKQDCTHLRPASTGVYCYIVTNGAFTPAGNSEEYVPLVCAIDAD